MVGIFQFQFELTLKRESASPFVAKALFFFCQVHSSKSLSVGPSAPAHLNATDFVLTELFLKKFENIFRPLNPYIHTLFLLPMVSVIGGFLLLVDIPVRYSGV